MNQIIFCHYCKQERKPKWKLSKKRLENTKYCSMTCKSQSQIGGKLSNETKIKISQTNSKALKDSWEHPSINRLRGIKKMAETKKRLYKEGKIKNWSTWENAAIISKKIGRPGKLNPMYGKKAWNSNLTKETNNKLLEISKKISEQAKLRIGKLNANWKGGISTLPYGPEFTNKLKEEIRNKFNKCLNCKINNQDHFLKYKYQLTIHHIDYDKFNNSLDNLISLCIVCNSRANGNREYWTFYYQRLLQKQILSTDFFIIQKGGE